MSNENVLVPSLLPVEEPPFKKESADQLNFIVRYEFLPKSVIARFIVRMHEDIYEALRWRTGVVLKSKVGEAIAFIRVDEDKRKIEISIQGDQRRDYLSVVVHSLRTINTTFRRLKVEERISLPDNLSISVDLNHLLYLEARGIETIIPEGSTREYDVGDLLGQVRNSTQSQKEIIKILRELKTDKDTEATLMSKVNEAVQIQPNFFGIGVNFNSIIRRIFEKDKGIKKK